MSTRYMLKQYVPMIAFAIFSLLAVLVQHEISYAASALGSVTAEVVVATKAAFHFGKLSAGSTPDGVVIVALAATMKDNPLTCAIRVPKNAINRIIHYGKSIEVNDFVCNLYGARIVEIIQQNLSIGTLLSVDTNAKVSKSCTGVFQVSVDYN